MIVLHGAVSYFKDPEKSHARNCESYMKDPEVVLTVQHEAVKVTRTWRRVAMTVLHGAVRGT